MSKRAQPHVTANQPPAEAPPAPPAPEPRRYETPAHDGQHYDTDPAPQQDRDSKPSYLLRMLYGTE